jgi:hypothetical protein
LAGETEVLGENLLQHHFVYHKSHMTRSEFEPGKPGLHIVVFELIVTLLADRLCSNG